MNGNQKFISGLLLGAAVGAAVVFFLNSEKGKALLSEAKEGIDGMEDEVSVKLREFDEAMNDLIAKGKSVVDELEQKLKPTEA